jgi:glycosyltransferase involved in cell wall biosynthesis
MKASLLLATYEMPRHLKLVLAALQRQTQQDFEILLCDDGSGDEVKQIVEAFKTTSKITIRHFWQKNEGFRKCRILNQAIKNAQGDVLIFLDGDCVPDQHFIEDHLQMTEQGCFLAGRRVELGPKISARLTPEKIKLGYLDWPKPSLILSALQKDSSNLNRTVRFKNPILRSLLKMDRIDDMKGCNFSVSRSDMIRINGFDEAYEGYGREDTDVEIRLKNLGLKMKSLKGLALQYHVWHERRGFTPVNDSLLQEAILNKKIRCKKGLDQS